MSKKKDKFVYKKKKIPRYVELLDRKLLQEYDWERPNNPTLHVTVHRLISLCSLTDNDSDAKAYWYICEHQSNLDDPDWHNNLTYGFFRRPTWDR